MVHLKVWLQDSASKCRVNAISNARLTLRSVTALVCPLRSVPFLVLHVWERFMSVTVRFPDTLEAFVLLHCREKSIYTAVCVLLVCRELKVLGSSTRGSARSNENSLFASCISLNFVMQTPHFSCRVQYLTSAKYFPLKFGFYTIYTHIQIKARRMRWTGWYLRDLATI
jgi:hypothetical protein